MERMGVEYQRFDGKEYVSLKRHYNLLCKCKALEKENKNLKSDLDRIKKRVKEHTTYTVKAEFIKKFGDIYVYDAKQVRDIC